MRVETQKNISVPPAAVWQLIDRPSSWKVWWQDCVEANTLDRKGLREGSTMEIVLQPAHRRISFFPRVEIFSAGRTLSLRYATFWVKAALTFQIHEHKDSGGTTAKVVLDYGGPQMVLARLLGQGDTVHLCIDRCLRGLKRVAERMG